MNILIVTHYFFPHVGGIELVAYNQAKLLAKMGHNITIVSSKLDDEKEIEYKDGIKIRRINVVNTLETYFGIPYPIFSSKIFKILREEITWADIINIHGQSYYHSLVCTYLAKKLNKKTIVTQHNTFIKYKNPLFNLMEITNDYIFGKYVLQNAKEIIVVSNATKLYVESIIGNTNKIKVLYNGIEVERFENVKLKKVFKEFRNKFICFCVRRIVFKNGIDTFLETAELLRDDKDIFFILGGKGADMEKVKTFIKNKNLKNIKLIGFISDEDLSKYYALADVFILPSKTGEGLPLVVLESFASGTPVIATNSGGQVEIVLNNKTGFIVQNNSPNEIATKIKFLKNSPILLKKMSTNCSKISKKRFKWSTNVETLLSIFWKNNDGFKE